MIQLFIPLTGLISVLAYYFLSNDMKTTKRANELEKMRTETNTEGPSEKYYGWELHDLI
jgi:hypothetical protein